MNGSQLKRILSVLLPATAVLLTHSIGHTQTCDTQILSTNASGQLGNGFSTEPAISADGRFVAFKSAASNLVSGGASGNIQVFVKERATGAIEGVSVSGAGSFGNKSSDAVQLSADGRFAVFHSLATNLDARDTNSWTDVYLRDRVLSTTELISFNASGNVGDFNSLFPHVSGDGRFVAFISDATNLTPGDNNGRRDVFVRDRLLGTIERVSLSSTGGDPDNDSNEVDLSDDGRYICFTSSATNIVANLSIPPFSRVVYLRDRALGLNRVVSSSNVGGLALDASGPSISADGRFVCFTSASDQLVGGDSNTLPDAFLWRQGTNWVTLESRNSAGVIGNSFSRSARLSRSGRFIAFESASTNFGAGPISGSYTGYLHDVATGQTSVATLAWDGTPVQPDVDSIGQPQVVPVTDDGTAVAFATLDHAVPNDHDGIQDVYVRECTPVPPIPPTVYCTAKVNSLGCTPAIGFVGAPSLSASSGFQIRVDFELNNKFGLFFYGVSGRAATPLQGGTLCLKPALKRTMLLNTGGNPPPANDCSGVLSFDWNAYVAGALGATPFEGTTFSGVVVDVQGWARDTGFSPPNNTSLSDALEFTTLP